MDENVHVKMSASWFSTSIPSLSAYIQQAKKRSKYKVCTEE